MILNYFQNHFLNHFLQYSRLFRELYEEQRKNQVFIHAQHSQFDKKNVETRDLVGLTSHRYIVFLYVISMYFLQRIRIWYPFLEKSIIKILTFTFYLSLFSTEKTKTWIIAIHDMKKGWKYEDYFRYVTQFKK